MPTGTSPFSTAPIRPPQAYRKADGVQPAFKARDVVPNLYEHWISKNILAYIRVALGSRERGEVLQMINRPARYISRDALQAPQISFDEVKGYYRDKD